MYTPVQNIVRKTIMLDQNFLIMKRCLTMLYSFPVTYAPLGHTPGAGFAILFFLGGLFQIPGQAERDNFPTQLLIDLIYVFWYIFLIRTKAKRHVFTTFIKVFLSLLREG